MGRAVGIRALKQNASAVVAAAAAGETITDRGRPVAQMVPLPASPLERMVELGRARGAHRDLTALDAPEPGPSLTRVLDEMRADAAAVEANGVAVVAPT